MIVLVMSEPGSPLSEKLFNTGVEALLCVTPDDVHLHPADGNTVSGAAIASSASVHIDVPKIKSQLLKAYPLMDRWVSKTQSISTTVELLLEYTVSLIKIIRSHSPRFAVLETGAPHHLFTYCLDAALRYLHIPVYYLYGNAFDGRCIVFEGNEKKSFVPADDYSAKAIVSSYIEQVQRNAGYIPADSTKSLSPVLHKRPEYALYLYLKQAAAKRYFQFKTRHARRSMPIRLTLPYVGFWELFRILKSHRAYLQLINRQGAFDVSRIGPNDIVYVGHMLPEATSFPECPDYPGEVDVLIDLKNRFPDSKVFYREHPAIALYSEFGHIHFQGLHKSPEFYRQLTRLGIEVIPPSMHISKIRAKDCLFATKTGRVAVENSVLGLPTIIYGYPFYGRDLPLALPADRLPETQSVQGIKAKLRVIREPAALVNDHLVAMFSRSIANPGIGLGSDTTARPQFDASVAKLISSLGAAGPDAVVRAASVQRIREIE